jgi:hypothetical protein
LFDDEPEISKLLDSNNSATVATSNSDLPSFRHRIDDKGNPTLLFDGDKADPLPESGKPLAKEDLISPKIEHPPEPMNLEYKINKNTGKIVPPVAAHDTNNQQQLVNGKQPSNKPG